MGIAKWFGELSTDGLSFTLYRLCLVLVIFFLLLHWVPPQSWGSSTTYDPGGQDYLTRGRTCSAEPMIFRKVPRYLPDLSIFVSLSHPPLVPGKMPIASPARKSKKLSKAWHFQAKRGTWVMLSRMNYVLSCPELESDWTMGFNVGRVLMHLYQP